MIGDATGIITFSLIFRLNSGFSPVPWSLAILPAREGSGVASTPMCASSRPAILPLYRSGPARRALESAGVEFIAATDGGDRRKAEEKPGLGRQF